jgi:hypothetical protein
MFEHWLEAELGRPPPPRIFFDANEIETGESWPHRLAEGVASSKLMVCLWSKEYFSSPWCLAELGHMAARRQSVGPPDAPLPIIIAVVIHDSERISPHLQDIQRFGIQDYANPWLARDSPKAEELSERIRVLARHVAHALERAPEYDTHWTELAVEEFIELFRVQSWQQDVPSLGSNLT